MNPASPSKEAGTDTTLGLRLRRAREAAGLSIAAAAEALHMPIVIVEAMEREDVERLGASIYVRGNYLSYARLVNLPAVLVDRFCGERSSQTPTLAPSTHVPRTRILFERYVKRSVYVVLTASIVPSVIWLASLDRQSAPVQTLLESPAGPTKTTTMTAPALTESVLSPAEPAAEDVMNESAQLPLQPVRASMAPAYATSVRATEVADTESAVRDAVVDVAPQEPALMLRFVEDSWFEVLDRDGSRLASGIARAGEVRSFKPAAVARVSLGNAGGVEVGVNGEIIDLTPFRRANVARFALSSAGSILPSDG